MLRKIDCVMVRVDALDEAAAFYARAFGLSRLWSDETAVGMGLPETDAEIVLHTMDLPDDATVHYLVDDVPAAVAEFEREGCTVRTPPFEVPVGRGAVLEDPYGNAVCILDLSTGRR
ncbi:VOC family protein [Actinoplanes bogorensis]|uniref:VOC family protein n=1 Tax=Paractinoplanes bogorensis TaxID=1610840 RepID=A0ABS5YZP6_9ACTN|nr:VOC family protein [Actinoplanes bogorensis]MBU2668923.1 VOC family protein [Actinoplanes bogorensis]